MRICICPTASTNFPNSSSLIIGEEVEGSTKNYTAAYELLVQDLENVDLSKPQMTAQLVANLQSAIQKSLVLGRTASVASNARALIELCGLGADRKHIQRQ